MVRHFRYNRSNFIFPTQVEKRFDCLLRSLNISENEPDPYTALLSKAYVNDRHADDYTLLHYTAVLLLFEKDKCQQANLMGKALLSHPRFMKDLHDEKKTGHPWNRVLWHVAQYAGLIGDYALSDYCYERALAVTREKPERLTMMTFAVSITAERLLHAGNASAEHRALLERDWNKANLELIRKQAPAEILQWFETDRPKLEWQSKAWLK